MECRPEASEDVTSVACPPLSVPVPRLVAPSRKLTVPVGVPAAGNTGVTVADSVTDCPTVPGLGEALTDVVVEP